MKTHRILFGAWLTLVLPAVLTAQPQSHPVQPQPALVHLRIQPDWSLRSPTANVADNGHSLSVGVTVENVGNGNAPAAKLRVWLKSSGDARVVEVPAVKVGGSRPLDLFSVLALPDSLAGTTDTVFFEVKGDGDANPDNNRAAVGFQVPAGPQRPDLAVKSVSDQYADDGAKLKLRVQVANNGDTASGPTTLEVSCTPPAWQPSRADCPSVQPGDAATVTIELAVPPRLRGRTVRFLIEVLPVSNEKNLENNRLQRDITLPTEHPQPLPNLSLSNPDYKVEEDCSRFEFWVDVRNDGESGSRSTRLELTSPGRDVSCSMDVQPLAPQGSRVCTLIVDVPKDLRGKTVEFIARVDPENSVLESNEDDNTIPCQVTILLSQEPVKDTAGEPPVPPRPRQFPMLLVIIGVSAVAAASLVWLLTRSPAFRRARLPRRAPEMARPEARPEEVMKKAAPPATAGAGAAAAGATRKVKDDVYFTVTSPAEVAPKADFLVNVWAHLDAQREEVLKRARQAEPKIELQSPGAGPFAIARDTELEVRLQIADCTVDSDKQTIRWTGTIANAGFGVRVNDGAAEGSKPGRVAILYRGLEIAKVRFLLQVTAAPNPVAATDATATTHRKAFASYARVDAHDVLTCIQGMERALPGISIFYDVLKFRSGEYWQTRLQQEILASDVFYLFWSKAAAGSEWVEKEWRFGLEKKGLDFIDPVPLVSPREAPPPAELSAKHFDDWELAFKSYQAAAALPAPSPGGGPQP